MGCVETDGYPRCYGAIYRNEGCTCPAPPRSRLEKRVAELEEQVRQMRGTIERLLECAGLENSE